MKPKLFMILSMVAFGTIALFVRGIPLRSAEVALFRAAIALGVILLAKRLRGHPLRLREAGRRLLPALQHQSEPAAERHENPGGLHDLPDH